MTSFNGFRNEHKPDHVQTVRGLAQELVDRLVEASAAAGLAAPEDLLLRIGASADALTGGSCV